MAGKESICGHFYSGIYKYVSHAIHILHMLLAEEAGLPIRLTHYRRRSVGFVTVG